MVGVGVGVSLGGVMVVPPGVVGDGVSVGVGDGVIVVPSGGVGEAAGHRIRRRGLNSKSHTTEPSPQISRKATRSPSPIPDTVPLDGPFSLMVAFVTPITRREF